MSVFDEDKLIDDAFLKRMGFSRNPIQAKGYFSKIYRSRYKDWGENPCVMIAPLIAYYSRPNNNLYIQKNSLSPQSKKYKIYNYDDFLKALYKHGLIYYKTENENSSI